MKIGLPKFEPTRHERAWVDGEVFTARFIQSLWNASGPKRRDPAFISLLVQCGWTNVRSDESGHEATRRWRNTHLANYLKVDYWSDDQLARELAKAFPGLKEPDELIRLHTGITHYYKSLRPGTVKFVEDHAKIIGEAFEKVSATRLNSAGRIRRVVNLVAGLGTIRIRNLEISPLNGLTPTLACLDPSERLPILNEKTRRLLKVIGEGQDAAGAVALSKLIDLPGIGIHNSAELDMYGATADFTRLPTHRHWKSPPGGFRDMGLKSEIESYAYIARNRRKIRRLHNRLTNLLEDYFKWRHLPIQECQFDAFIPEWRPGRHLLIEAKTASDGNQGRMQIRQAIGQLYDYRYTFAARFPKGTRGPCRSPSVRAGR